MNFWWVNHSQTFRHEFFGKYIWSPKRKRNDQINPFYETMREVAPDDIVYSFADGAIQGFGVARTHCYTSPRPDEFGHIGQAWNEVGWRVDIDFQRFTESIFPQRHVQVIAPTLPERYSPIRSNGYGNQGVYLAQIPRPMALVIAQLASPELLGIIQGFRLAETADTPLPELRGIVEWEKRECEQICASRQLPDTEKQALIKARRGQGLFRQNVARIEHFCRVTRVDRPEHLIASHIKPWRESDNRERLFEGNGLLLTPTIDHLFDRGFISFENDGELLISPVAHEESMCAASPGIGKRDGLSYIIGPRPKDRYGRTTTTTFLQPREGQNLTGTLFGWDVHFRGVPETSNPALDVLQLAENLFRERNGSF